MGATWRPVGCGASKSGTGISHEVSGPGSCWQSRTLSLPLESCQLFTKFYPEAGKWTQHGAINRFSHPSTFLIANFTLSTSRQTLSNIIIYFASYPIFGETASNAWSRGEIIYFSLWIELLLFHISQEKLIDFLLGLLWSKLENPALCNFP